MHSDHGTTTTCGVYDHGTSLTYKVSRYYTYSGTTYGYSGGYGSATHHGYIIGSNVVVDSSSDVVDSSRYYIPCIHGTYHDHTHDTNDHHDHDVNVYSNDHAYCVVPSPTPTPMINIKFAFILFYFIYLFYRAPRFFSRTAAQPPRQLRFTRDSHGLVEIESDHHE